MTLRQRKRRHYKRVMYERKFDWKIGALFQDIAKELGIT